MKYKIHLFKLEGESILYVEAETLEDAQREALNKAKDLTFTPGRLPYMAVAFDFLEEVETPQEEPSP